MVKVHPDHAPIEPLHRTHDDLAILPRLDRSGMKSLHLDVPTSTAQRLRSGTTGSTTQAIAIIARWVLETLEKDGQRLVADPAHPTGHRLEGALDLPRIDARLRKAVSTSGVGTEPMLASLPPNTHRILRDECAGSLRRVVMTALQYGIERLDAENLTLRLSESGKNSSRHGRVLMNVGNIRNLDTNSYEEREAWVKKARATLLWLGFDAALLEDVPTVEGDDLLLHFGDVPKGMSLPQDVQEIPLQALWAHPVKWFALNGEWCSGMPESLLQRRGRFCNQCGYGQSEGHLVQLEAPVEEGQGVMLCSHCFRMCSH